MTRKECNYYILSILEVLINKYPDLRFGQLLIDSNILKLTMIEDRILMEDCFNDESINILYRLLNSKMCKTIMDEIIS